MGVALLVPFTYAMSPTLAMVLLTAVYLARRLWRLHQRRDPECAEYTSLGGHTPSMDIP